jgi:hypothetical protein
VPKAPSPSELRELAKSRLRLRELPVVDQRTPEERRLENGELLRKLQRMRPDLYDRVSEVVANSDEDWFALLEQHLGKEIALQVAEISLMQGW